MAADERVPTTGAFLDDEAAAWAPFERLVALADDQFEAPVEAAHGWSARDVIAHVVAWLDDAIDVARELEAGGDGAARRRSNEAFAARGDEINAEIQATWTALPLDAVRDRARTLRATLRDQIASVPADRWSRADDDARFLRLYTVGHYADHADDLAAILEAARA